MNLPHKRAYKRRYGKNRRWMSATAPNAIWAFDFLSDECANGQKLRIFAVKDEFTRKILAIEVEKRFRAQAVVSTLERLCSVNGKPTFLRCDNGPEFISHAIKRWAASKGIQISYTEPGKPWQNGSIESFNSRFRDACLDREWFANRAEARAVIQSWRDYYNKERPHSAMKYKTPYEVRLAHLNSCQPVLKHVIQAAA